MKTLKVGRARKPHYEQVIEAGIANDFKSIEFIPDEGLNPAGFGDVRMNLEDAKKFIPIKEELNKNQMWAINGIHDEIED